MIDLTGFIDLHIHSGPDVVARVLDDFEIVRQAADAGMAGVMLKSHVTGTADRAAIAQQHAGRDISVWGGLALNHAVGGFNPAAVEAALSMGARQIWMPTRDAANEHQPGTGLSVLDDAGTIREEVHAILALIAEADAILGTGHIGVDEIAQLIPAAKAAGVQRILLTHPDSHAIDVPLEMQREYAGMDCYFDRCWYTTLLKPPKRITPEKIFHAIRTVGVESTILSTDLGAAGHPTPVDGFRDYIRAALHAGYSVREIERMAAVNPRTLAGLTRMVC